jgi:hypothetical protein
MDEVPCYQGLLIYLKIASQDDVIYARWEVYIHTCFARNGKHEHKYKHNHKILTAANRCKISILSTKSKIYTHFTFPCTFYACERHDVK